MVMLHGHRVVPGLHLESKHNGCIFFVQAQAFIKTNMHQTQSKCKGGISKHLVYL